MLPTWLRLETKIVVDVHTAFLDSGYENPRQRGCLIRTLDVPYGTDDEKRNENQYLFGIWSKVASEHHLMNKSDSSRRDPTPRYEVVRRSRASFTPKPTRTLPLAVRSIV